MDKREFLKVSGATLVSTLLPKFTAAQTTAEKRTNWAGNYTYVAKELDLAGTVEDIRHNIRAHTHLKALGARHSFNNIADSPEEQISLKHFDKIELDIKAKTVTVGAGVTYGQLAPYIEAQADMAHPAEGDEVFENSAKNVKYLKALAVWIFHRAARNLPEQPDENRGINPLAISLHPERWEADGLYSDDGISLVQAREMLPGIEEMDLEARGAVVAA